MQTANTTSTQTKDLRKEKFYHYRDAYAPFLLANIAHYMLYEAEREYIFRHREKQILERSKKAAYDFEQCFFRVIPATIDYDLMKHQTVVDAFREYLMPSLTLLKLYIRQKLSNARHGKIEILSIICTLDIVMQLITIYSLYGYKRVDPKMDVILKNTDRLRDMISRNDKTIITLEDNTFNSHIASIEHKIDTFNYELFYF